MSFKFKRRKKVGNEIMIDIDTSNMYEYIRIKQIRQPTVEFMSPCKFKILPGEAWLTTEQAEETIQALKKAIKYLKRSE